MYCILLLAFYGCVIGSILGIGNYIIFQSLPTLSIGEPYFHMVHGMGIALVWGIGLGGVLGGCKALISRGDNWTERMSTKNIELKYGCIPTEKV